MRAVQVTLDSDTQEPQDELLSTTMAWFQSAGVEVSTVSDVLSSDDERITQSIQDGITRANQRAISRAQDIQKWRILPRDFSIIHGELGQCTCVLLANVCPNVLTEFITKSRQQTENCFLFSQQNMLVIWIFLWILDHDPAFFTIRR